MSRSKNIYLDFLILAIVVIIAYWQVCLSQFTIKGDAALLSVPWKKYVSDSLRNGYLPVWNPYINLGWMQGMEPSTWYYPSWIFALFGKFRLSFLQVEIGLHFILGAFGMYKLLSLLKLDRIALIGASIAYILSGFFVGNFQHLGWTYFGCWLPVFLYCFFKTAYVPSFPNSFKLGISASMLVLSSYIPFTVTTLLFSCVFIIVFTLKKAIHKDFSFAGKTALHILTAIIVFTFICSPALFMLFTNLDTMYRGGRYDDATASFGSLLPGSLITFFLPFASTAGAEYWKGTDISMNNAFFGILSLVFAAWAFTGKSSRKIAIIVAIAGVLAFVISMGPFIPPSWYLFRHLPFYEKLRFASQFRIYFIMAGCILSAIGINHLLKENTFKKTGFILIILTLALLLTGCLNYSREFFVFTEAIIIEGQNTATIHHSAGFQATVFAVVCITFSIPVIIYRRLPKKLTLALMVLNVVLLVTAVQMNFFYTGVANMRMKKIDDMFISLPEKFSPIENHTFHEYWKPAVGYTWTNTGGISHVPNVNCYHPYDSPNYAEYLRLSSEKEKQAPFIYSKNTLSQDLEKSCNEVLLTPYSLNFTNTEKDADSLFIQISTYGSTHLKINGQRSDINMIRGQVCITGITLNSRVEIRFLPSGLVQLVLLSMLAFCSIGIYVLVYKIRGRKIKNLD